MIILSQHLFPRDSESPAVPPKKKNFAFWGGRQKILGANAPTPSPQNLHQVSAIGYTIHLGADCSTIFLERDGHNVD